MQNKCVNKTHKWYYYGSNKPITRLTKIPDTSRTDLQNVIFPLGLCTYIKSVYVLQ